MCQALGLISRGTRGDTMLKKTPVGRALTRRPHRNGRHRPAAYVAAFAAVGAMVGAALMLTPTTAPADAAEQAAPVIVILDASGSMAREVSPGRSRMDVAKQATIATLDALPQGTPVGVLVFGTGTGNTKKEQAAGCKDVTTVVPLGAAPRGITEKIDGITESGFTPIGPALTKAAQMLPKDTPANIVLVSDGVDTCAPPSSCEVASQLHRDNPRLSINVVGFGVDDDEQAQQQMTCIGGVGGGTAVSASDPAQLLSRLRAASTAVSNTRDLSVNGTRGVRLGMTLDEVRAAVDGAQVGVPKTVDGVVVIVVDCGWGTVTLHDNRVYAITPRSTKTATAEGIHPGSTLQQAAALYGNPVATDTADNGPSQVYQVQPGSPIGYRMFYDSATNRIRTIIVCRCVPESVLASADPSQWLIDYDGVGPLHLGMTLDAARQAVPGLTKGSDDGQPWWALPGSTGLTAVELSDDHGVWLTAAFGSDGRLRAVTVQDPQWSWGDDSRLPDGAPYPNARGIRLGDSMQTAINAFPGGSYFSNLAGGRHDYTNMNRQSHVLSFSEGPSTRPVAQDDSSPIETEQSIAQTTVASITLSDRSTPGAQ